MPPIVHFVAISGSIRRLSSSTELLRAASRLAPQGVTVTLYRGIEDLPPFNPDEDVTPAPETVTDLRSLLAGANAVVFATPEYAHGYPGVLKNALDWLVSSGELFDKPCVLFNTSPRAHHAQESLVEVLRTMGARVDASAIAVPLLGRRLDAMSIIEDDTIATTVRAALATLQTRVTSEA